MEQLTTKQQQTAGGKVTCSIYRSADGIVEMSFSFAGKTTPEVEYSTVEAAKLAAQKFAFPYGGKSFVFGPMEYDYDFGGDSCTGSFVRGMAA